MNSIINYYEDIFSRLPKTFRALKIKKQLLSNSQDQYESFVKAGYTKKIASKKAIFTIPPIEKINEYIPISIFDINTLFTLVTIIAFVFIHQFVCREEFLQIFWPVVLEFPLIIRNAIICLSFSICAYHILKIAHKYLPYKYCNHYAILDNTFKILSISIVACYLTSALVFSFYTFSGFEFKTFNYDPFFKLLLYMYENIILNQTNNYLFGLFIAVLYIAGEENLHKSYGFIDYDKEAIDKFQFQYINDKETLEETVINDTSKNNTETSDIDIISDKEETTEEIVIDDTSKNNTETSDIDIISDKEETTEEIVIDDNKYKANKNINKKINNNKKRKKVTN
jgi:hypothetical protein